ncbi:Signal recognition particle receptor protein FtsY (=alpha subunit) (TC 3.A.5.1.1) [Citrobacter europaeus]|jgi:fused signal recognition particle receptor|uniref:signal recognition particle-docking protein FtsY n=1 Tax=Citrobacter TaxID=544 RepID=UPI000885A0BF|nr:MULTISPECIES: signal recognition particle-docking protein FtsY [Citrobacter]MBJ9267833.1 signal recognition particle-docking protein FtsY [Citrobacter freundii]MDM3274448.1 signal recognition particle-docking protein FtsY [Citrobacter sp. Ce119]MDM3289696.1 signal recognition particle-docking protein FtsY [Citrobacter sp. Ce105]UBI15812.1 signal recognition particle-docking protein FtsY [Citrobacter europaeus]CAD7556762.1 Signal recognition particle receptor protein FtsY (=alpha subunit) (T
MAKEKKRGFFSWLGFGQKEQAPENETEVKNEEQQPVAEETTVVDEQPHVEETRSEAETQAFAAEVVEVTEQVAEIEKLQPEDEPVAEQAQLEIEPVAETVVETPAAVVIEREELPLPEEVKTEDVSAEEWQAEAETVEIVEAAEEEAENEPQLTDEELEAQALAAEAAEEAVIVVPVEEPAVEEPVKEEAVQEQEKPTKEGFFARLKRSLLKTKENLGSGFISLFRGKKIDDDLFEELEEQLLIADVGVETTRKIIANLTEGASRKQLKDAEALYGLLKDEMGEILAKVDEPLNVDGKTPFVILMVGVNGVGKTTTIGKLARQFEQQGKSVMLAAGDTFRAAAVEQLQVWGQRNNIPVIAQHTGADSASVIFDAIQAAKARNVDVLIADTAGRLQNKSHLMEELKKIVRVMKKLDEDAPHEVMLTIDASTGQNAISQAKLFHEAVGLTGITLTKLDGTAKGGVIFSVADQFGIPIRYIGVGERIEDLRPFKADDFIEALFARED